MANDDSESLREFATFIQQKAAQPKPVRDAPPSGDSTPVTPRLDAHRTATGRRSNVVASGIAAGIGVAIGFLLGKLTR